MFFWVVLYQYHLNYQEQVQLFSFTWAHLGKMLSFPGGICSYLSEFFVQFFISRWLGAIIMTALICGVQLLTWALMNVRRKPDARFYPLSFIPSLCCWAFLVGSNNLPSAVIALVIVMAAALISAKKGGVALKLALTPVLYYICGPMAFIYVLLLKSVADFKSVREMGLIAFMAAIAVASAFIASALCKQYPLGGFFYGLDYSSLQGVPGKSFFVMALMPAVLTFCARILPEGDHKGWFIPALLYVLVLLGGAKYVVSNTSAELEHIYAYDVATVRRDWTRIFSIGTARIPSTPSELTCLNLALAMCDKMGDNMFCFYQNGLSGLYPNYRNGYLLMLPAGEALYQSGLLNMAMHYSFEAYESYPDFRESARHLKRLAEINMINGQQAVADKYLTKLSHTLFYRKWAKTYLGHPERIADDPEYARLMELRDTSDMIFNDVDDEAKREVLRSIVARTHKTGVTFNYLMAADLLERDVPAFMEDLELVEFEGSLPTHYQEALIMPWLRGWDAEAINDPRVSDEVRDRAIKFRNDVVNRKGDNYMIRNYGNTYWAYYIRTK